MLVIDVQGFYAPQIHADVELTGTLTQATSRVLSSSRPATGQYSITVDRNVSTCSADATPDGSGAFVANAVTNSGNTVTVYTYNSSTGAATNIRFTLTVVC
jgi:hypothetical protein